MSSVEEAEGAESGSKESIIQEVTRLSLESRAIPLSNDSFQGLQNELQEFLSSHIARLNAVRDGMSKTDRKRETLQSESSTSLPRNDVLSAEALCDYPPTAEFTRGTQSIRWSSSIGKLEAHKALLSQFLEEHMKNLRNLQVALSANTNQETAVENTQLHNISEKQYDALADQFNMLVIISTFTAALILAFLSLVYDIMGTDHPLAFSFGMLLSFLAMAVHLGTIIVAARGAALTSQHQAGDDSEAFYDLKYFHLYLGLCEQLQFLATILFIVSIVVLSFFIFTSIAFPIVLLVLGLLASLFVFWSVYWRVSITFRNLKLLLGGVRKLRERRYRRSYR